MQHISSQWETPGWKRKDHRSSKPRKWSDFRDKDGGKPGHSRSTEKQGSLSTLGTKSSEASLNQVSQTSGQYLTPPSSTSSVFDSPGKRSPSSSVSSILPICIHELEDPSSIPTKMHELEDTSKVVSSTKKSLPAYESLKPKSTYPSSLSIISAVDQQLTALEDEIRSLRLTVTANEHAVMNAKHIVKTAQEAVANANRTISERESQLEERNRLIAELQKEVDICRANHSTPVTPAKPRDPVSRFNATSPVRTPSPLSMLASISMPSLPALTETPTAPTVKFAAQTTIIPPSKSQTANSLAAAMAAASSEVPTSTPSRSKTSPLSDRFVMPMMSGGLSSADTTSQGLPRPMERVEPPKPVKAKHKKGALNFLRRKT